ncbi:unnamed protein product [Spodoptera littoralis]|uniref:G-patch domain-containing protein n=1 Tax=Spodoptera littoralis TaxID=7109 RepID=A0A9P0I7B2_SPOLI|nr:unnamed protein product [Spodoptera littoralis]CAH1640735.1 unnamed protein product [Spodoptera littoralis]
MIDSDDDHDNFVRYGTALDPIEEDEVPSKRKFQQAPDQYAVDEHGRRRFHGAFTGGFSAGFGNTVGSQEGWTPTSFKSSRSEKAAFSNQRPEDFMDEEDRGEFGIAPRQVQTQREFSGQKRQHRTQYHDGPIPGEPVLHQLLRPVHETAAVRMLRAMGWREGQGMGERLSSQDKKKSKEQHKVYGCYMPPELRQAQEDQSMDDSESSDSEVDFDTLFAPDDYEPYILQRKNDRFGLGYSGLSRHSVLGNLVGEYGSEPGSSKSHLVMKDKGKRVSIRGQAFGVGAFEADDEDIYAREDMSHYDFSLDDPVHTKKNTKDKDAQKNRNVLEGFVKSTKPLPSVPTYPPPALPRDYTPAAAGARRSRFEPTTQQPRDQGLGRHELSARARGELLGETPVPPPPPEPPVKDQIDQKDLSTILGKTINFVSTVEKTELDYIPIKDSGKEITKVFKPFIGNPEKQKRYDKYLENKGMLERDGDMDKLQEWERERELVEFEQAAKLYKPLSGVMGDRFTHASEPDDAVNPLTAVAKSSSTYGLATKEQIEAAQKGVYGVMTRQTITWRPDPLVSKRFNVPEIGGARQQEKKEDRPKVSYSIFSYLESSVHDKDSFAAEQSKFSGSKSLTTNILPKNDQKANEIPQISTQNNDRTVPSTDNIIKPTTSASISKETTIGFAKRMTVAELFLKESENTKKEGAEVTDTIQKFDRMDLYKSIFLSDTEDEEDTEKSKENDGTDFIDVPKNVERNMSPPRGIFANIDFDEINSWRRKEPEKVPEASTKKDESVNDVSKKVDKPEEKNDDEAMYGPKIPENLQKRLESEVHKEDLKETIDVDSTSSEDSWVDIKEVKNKKQKKKKSKKHKSKHKKKSKSKKKDK